MSGKSHATRRARKSGLVNLYPSNTTLGWRLVGLVTPSVAAEKLATGEYREVYDDADNFLGVQMLASKKRLDHSSNPSSCSISLNEIKRIAGLEGESVTLNLSMREHARVAEDAIERAINKLMQWPYPASRIDDGTGEPKYGDRAVRCYPRPAK